MEGTTTALLLLGLLGASSPSHLDIQKMTGVSLSAAQASIESGSGCTGGLVYDDGSFEDALRTTSTLAHNLVMEFTLPGATNRIDAVCVCWSRANLDTSVTYRLNIYAADGPSGGPGTLLGFATPNFATPTLFGRDFFRVEIPGGISVPTNHVYIGPAWSELLDDDFFLCVDENGAGGHQAYFGTDLVNAPSTRITDTSYKALGVRVEAVATSTCQPSATAICLNNNRFKVEATFETPSGQSGPAQAVKLTNDSGYLWFFSSTNIEAVIKVLDGCGLNQNYWVFAGGLTNVRTVITVTDTETGTFKTYTNPQGKAFQPVQDTSALPVCP